MQLSIITSLFNRLDLTRAYLESLERTLQKWRYEVIFIDDGSTDGTRNFLRTLSGPRYQIVINETPRGFAANNNAGARLARAPLLALLNNDLVLRPGWLEPMARLARWVPDAACVGNVQREPVSGLIDHYGVYFHADGYALHAGKNQAVAPEEPYLSWPAVTAACWVIRKKLFLGLGGFDEEYRNGYEDVDFCLRASVRGYRHFVVNRSVIYHHISASPNRKLHEENNFRLFRQRWGERLATEFRVRKTVEDQRREGLGYLSKHRWRPWRYSAWRFCQALEKAWSPLPPSRQLNWLPRQLFRLHDLIQGLKAREGDTASPDDAGKKAPRIFMLVDDAVWNPGRSGVPTAVRNLAAAFGRTQAPVRLALWNAADRCACALPSEMSMGEDAEPLRDPAAERLRDASAASLYQPSAGSLHDLSAQCPALHELPAFSAPPPEAWILAPEPLYGDRAAHLAEYVRRHGWRLAVIFHDAIPPKAPALVPPGLPHEHAMYMRACSGADLILPVSLFSAGDWHGFVADQGLPKPPVHFCALAADTCARTRETATNPPPRGPTAPVRILCVSAVGPRKNHRALVAAYELAIAARPGLNLELCFVGEHRVSMENNSGAINDAMARHPGKVSWYEQVEYSTLRKLYEACDFTVYPSELEGFGLPIIESLWFGRPCICANFGAMAELAAGGGCLAVDVRDPQSLADAILSLAEDSGPLAAEAVARRLKTWDEYAAEIIAALDAQPEPKRQAI